LAIFDGFVILKQRMRASVIELGEKKAAGRGLKNGGRNEGTREGAATPPRGFSTTSFDQRRCFLSHLQTREISKKRGTIAFKVQSSLDLDIPISIQPGRNRNARCNSPRTRHERLLRVDYFFSRPALFRLSTRLQLPFSVRGVMDKMTYHAGCEQSEGQRPRRARWRERRGTWFTVFGLR